MNDIAIKYNRLSKTAKQELDDFLDFLLSRQKVEVKKVLTTYKKKILAVSEWTDDDCTIFEENQKKFSQWKIQNW
jgi:hypothetical protein